jgi:hypothetical protein
LELEIFILRSQAPAEDYIDMHGAFNV